MISWLLIIILAYLFFALASLGDKLILAGPPKPASYVFFVGISNIALLILLPFIKWAFPRPPVLWWIILEAFVFLIALYALYSAVEKFEISRVATTMGAAMPIFVFILGWLVWQEKTMSKTNLLAFGLLILGNVIISARKNGRLAAGYLKITLFASLLFAFDYVITKIIFLSEPFLFGFFWMRVFAFLLAFTLLFPKENRKNIFAKKSFLNKKTGSIFVLTSGAGGIANLLQAFAISLAPIALLPILNALRGIQYVFTFLIALFFSLFFPKILKENISKKIIFQKIVSILIIAGGLALLVL